MFGRLSCYKQQQQFAPLAQSVYVMFAFRFNTCTKTHAVFNDALVQFVQAVSKRSNIVTL